MKKLIIIVLIIALINLISVLVCVYKINKYECRSKIVDKCKIDTTINKFRIDSIQLVIKTKDSIITKIKEYEKEEINNASNLNDSDAIKLFKKLVSN